MITSQSCIRNKKKQIIDCSICQENFNAQTNLFCFIYLYAHTHTHTHTHTHRYIYIYIYILKGETRTRRSIC